MDTIGAAPGVPPPPPVEVGLGDGDGDVVGEVLGDGDGLGEEVAPPLQVVPLRVKVAGAVLVPL
jgi:hypothetical protein